MSAVLDERRRRSATELLQLLTREERQDVCARLGFKLPEKKLKPKDELEAIGAELSRLPRHRVLAELLDVAEPLASMLREIVSFLERHGVAARTTGFALGLAHPTGRLGMNTIDLSPQEVGRICSWPTKTLRKLGEDPFEEAGRDWRSLRAGWTALLDRSRTRVESGDIDPFETAMERRRNMIEGRFDPDPLKFKPDRDYTDYEAQDVLRHLLERVEQTLDVLQRIPPAERATPVRKLILALKTLVDDGQRCLDGVPGHATRPRGRSAARALERTLATYRRRRFPKNGFFDRLDRFEEDIRALAHLTEADAFLDALRLELWKNRPQLFEVWVLVSILDWIERRGYDIKLLEVQGPPTGRLVWKLKYAGDSKPCARVTGGGRSEFVFYQFFQSSKASGNDGAMPDLALLRGCTGDAERVWAIDPKLSLTYERADYEATARKYLTEFGAPLAVVVEYFPRKGEKENPVRLFEAEDGWLVTDASPSGNGLPHVLDRIAASHPALPRILLCVDMSASFEPRRPQALRAAAATLAGRADAVADRYVCFAGNAVAMDGMHEFLRAGGTTALPAPHLSPGTAVGALIVKLREVMADLGPIRVEVIGDGEFGETGWIERMATELGADVRLQT